MVTIMYLLYSVNAYIIQRCDQNKVIFYSILFYSATKCARVGVRDSLWMFFAYTKMLGRTETRTRDRMHCQMMRAVRDIYRDDRARIATCSLRHRQT